MARVAYCWRDLGVTPLRVPSRACALLRHLVAHFVPSCVKLCISGGVAWLVRSGRGNAFLRESRILRIGRVPHGLSSAAALQNVPHMIISVYVGLSFFGAPLFGRSYIWKPKEHHTSGGSPKKTTHPLLNFVSWGVILRTSTTIRFCH